MPSIDPTGQRLFAPQVRFRQEPGRQTRHHDVCISLLPDKVVAPVGAEVVMVAGVCGKSGHLLADERVEWMLEPSGVGHLVDVGHGTHVDWLRHARNRPHKVDNTFAIGRTTNRFTILNRGTPSPDDDVPILAGQAWVTVTSAVEGVTHLTAFAPDVYGWDSRRKTSQIYWLDAEWRFPPSAVNPVGTRHVFTTTVTRHTDRTPIAGWRVRYEIVDGPPAGFAPSGASMLEVPTDELGQASVELFQQQPSPGTNSIRIQLIRPAENGRGERLVVATSQVQKTWTAPSISLRKTGPAQASVGAAAVYQIQIRNPGDVPARDVVVTDEIPEGMSYVGSNPQATVSGNRLEWRLGEVGPGHTRTLEVTFRAERAGTVQNCANLTAGDGLQAQDCVTTTILVPSLDVSMVGPRTAQVGQDVTFEVTITNRGELPATGLLIVSRYDDAGLSHVTGANPIERDLPDLPPGASSNIGVTLRVLQPGEWCNEIIITGEGGLRATARACVQAEAAPGAPPPTDVPPADVPPRQARIAVQKTGPDLQAVGRVAEFTITITNTGPVRVTDLQVVDTYDEALNPILATDGYVFVGDDIVWRIDELPPGRSATLQIHCRCTVPAERSCNAVTVTTAEGARADDEACLEIRPAQGGLSMSVSDVRDPVSVGGETTYEIQVRNNAGVVDRQVTLDVVLPSEVMPIAAGTTGPTQHTIEGRTVRFRPVAEIRPGETLRYSVQVRTERPGQVRITATLNSEGRTQALSVDETTMIFAE